MAILNEDRLVRSKPKIPGTGQNPNGRHSSTIDLTISCPDLSNQTDISNGSYYGSDHLPFINQLHINSPSLYKQQKNTGNYIYANGETLTMI